jgi:hypothetical protein
VLITIKLFIWPNWTNTLPFALVSLCMVYLSTTYAI